MLAIGHSVSSKSQCKVLHLESEACLPELQPNQYYWLLFLYVRRSSPSVSSFVSVQPTQNLLRQESAGYHHTPHRSGPTFKSLWEARAQTQASCDLNIAHSLFEGPVRAAIEHTKCLCYQKHSTKIRIKCDNVILLMVYLIIICILFPILYELKP